MFPNAPILAPLFWIVMGGLYTFFAIGIYFYIRDLKVRMQWWKWTLATIWFIGLNVVIAGATTLFGESEWRAGLSFLGVFGTLLLVLGVGLKRLIFSK